MLRATSALVVLATVAALASAQPQGLGWNELLSAKGIFHADIDAIQARSGDKHVVLAELDDLLAQEGVLTSLYSKYLTTIKRQNPTYSTNSIANFKASLARVAAHNLEARNGEHSWTRGINHFSDMSLDELFTQYAMNAEEMAALKNSTGTLTNPPYAPRLIGEVIGDDESKDWRDSGRVTNVKNQGQCGSCTSFATTAQLETNRALYVTGATPPDSLSQQEVIDCSNPSSDKCSGMWPEAQYDFYKSNGVTTLASYPYEGKGDKSCRKAGKTHDAKSGAWYKAFSESEADIKKSVSGWGVVYVCINVSQGIYDYNGGVFSGDCGATKGLHSVAAVGYGNKDGKDTWIIKNSWGVGYGESGYLIMERGTNKCNIQQHPRILLAQ